MNPHRFAVSPPSPRSAFGVACLLLTLMLAGNSINRVAAQTCSTTTFTEHPLSHTTQTRGNAVRFYESNGSGVAINDLNNDGLLDIVLGNLKGANRILWNQGALQFRPYEFLRPTGRTRAVHTVDVDADGWIDIIFTTQTAAPQFWRNNHDETFTLTPLPGVRHLAYTLAWADADYDGDLDLFTASYDAELLQLLRDSFLFGSGAGVYFYENRAGVYYPTRIAHDSQALALWASDLNGDHHLDLVVGNDFSLPDQAWSYHDGVREPVTLFETIPHSTMSFDAGDIDNDGILDFFAADMRPVDNSPLIEAAWRYALDDIASAPRTPGDRQVNHNMLFQPHSSRLDTLLTDTADAFGVAASGWSWSSKFGDLNHDGYLDLYVVNGMASVELFGHLPNDELIEPNYAFRSDAGRAFIPAPEWNLGSLSGGRGMSMGDLDNDGDLDIVVNNLNTPAQLFENHPCGGDSLQVDVRWHDSPNPFGIGARLTLYTSSGTYTRDMRAASGYLSGDPARVHFGFPVGSQLQRLDVHWTDGTLTTVSSFDAAPFLTVYR